ncbi:MAG: RagB/SusD family nutrient uptake outer membrane protein [Bacteroidales bacterium]
MKNYIILLLYVGLFGVCLTSCKSDFLDKYPESGLPEQDVFMKYENFLKYFRGNNTNIRWAFPFYSLAIGQYVFAWDQMTDISSPGHNNDASDVVATKQGDWRAANSDFHASIYPMFSSIRRCNMTINKIEMLQDATQEDKYDLLAQAYFFRAFSHFHLVKLYGGQPYITKVLTVDDPWDYVRLSPHETLTKIAADLDTAYTFYVKAGRIRRDNPIPGAPGNLNHPDMQYPNGVAAKALKSRVLLYAASPLNNKNGITDWQNAAIASWEAIQLAETWGYFLLPAADYKTNFCGATYTNEQIWGWHYGTARYLKSVTPQFFSPGTTYLSGENPTQNLVDMFETRWGEPLNTEADRQAATAAGHYNEQDPYKDRDPRFYVDIIYNEAPLLGFGTAKIYYEMIGGSPVYSPILNRNQSDWTKTGYLGRKQWGNQSTQYNNVDVLYTDPLIRLAELYLNYAEAANEAYGPNGSAPGATMTALQALNFVRRRIGHVDVLPAYTTNKDVLRPRIKNERTIELCFEGHRYHDVRRWMDAPEAYSPPLMGIDIEKLPAGYDPVEYPTGYRYTRVPLPSYYQVAWKDVMYYFPHPLSECYKMKLFICNPQW